MATGKEWDELIQYHNKENQDDKVYNNMRNEKHDNVNTNDYVDNWTTSTIAWRFTTCTSTNSSTERAHVVLFLAHFITLTLAQVRALPALHSRPSPWSSMWLLSLRLDFLFLPLRLPPVCLPLPFLLPQRRAAARAQQEDHGKLVRLRQQRGEGTYDVLNLTTGYEPNGHDFNELQNSSVPYLLQDPCRGPGRG